MTNLPNKIERFHVTFIRGNVQPVDPSKNYAVAFPKGDEMTTIKVTKDKLAESIRDMLASGWMVQNINRVVSTKYETKWL